MSKSSTATKKRQRDTTDDGVEESPASKKPTQLKLLANKGKTNGNNKNVPQTPLSATHTRLKIKAKGKPPKRPLGVGYDSEDDDAEEDPSIEENLILRMQPGPDCDYLRHAIENRMIGVPRHQGGADVFMRFFKHRRAVISIQGRHYAAVIVDLPCIIESMKSFDKKGWVKSADICQMLLVYRVVESETAAADCPLPSSVNTETWQWPHGLTPPMHNVRKRRFRKRVSYRTIEEAEDEVQKLLDADRRCEAAGGVTHAEVVDMDEAGTNLGDFDEEDMDAVGEVDYDEEGEDDEEDDDGDDDDEEEDAEAMAARMALELGAADDSIMAEVSTPASAGAPVDTSSAAPTPAAAAPAGASGEESDEDESEEESDEAEEDEGARERMQMLQQQREEIEHLKSQIEQTRAQATPHPLIQQRAQKRIETLQKELDNKMRSIGMTADDDDA